MISLENGRKHVYCGGRSSLVEWKLPKLQRRVQFPSSALFGRLAGAKRGRGLYLGGKIPPFFAFQIFLVSESLLEEGKGPHLHICSFLIIKCPKEGKAGFPESLLSLKEFAYL